MQTSPTSLRLVVGISGSSGSLYGIRLLQIARALPGVETHLVMSHAADRTLALETEDWTPEAVRALADRVHDVDDLGAPIASGSFRAHGMVVAPCSMKTLSSIARAGCENLLTRAADVTLKERRRLVLLPRETPLNLAHLRNMVAVTEMGAIVLPPIVALYHRPRTILDVVDHTVSRALDLLGIENDAGPRWGEAPA